MRDANGFAVAYVYGRSTEAEAVTANSALQGNAAGEGSVV
jgi:hypothetical protein